MNKRYMIFEIGQEGLIPLTYFGNYHRPTKCIKKTYKLERNAWKVIEKYADNDSIKAYTVQPVMINEINVNGRLLK